MRIRSRAARRTAKKVVGDADQVNRHRHHAATGVPAGSPVSGHIQLRGGDGHCDTCSDKRGSVNEIDHLPTSSSSAASVRGSTGRDHSKGKMLLFVHKMSCADAAVEGYNPLAPRGAKDLADVWQRTEKRYHRSRKWRESTISGRN